MKNEFRMWEKLSLLEQYLFSAGDETGTCRHTFHRHERCYSRREPDGAQYKSI